jgi:hypothetical protein
MPRFNEIINNFINGEVSPKLFGRTDSEVYKRSCRTLNNMIVHPQGGASRRVGTEFVSDFLPIIDAGADDVVQELNSKGRVVPFFFDEDEKYLIVFNAHQRASDGKNQIQYYFVDEDVVVAASFSPQTIVNYAGTKEARVSTDYSTVELDAGLTLEATISELQYVQVGAVMVFVHPDMPPFCVIRESRGRLQFVPYNYQFLAGADGAAGATTDFGPWPFQQQNYTDINLKVNIVTPGSRTVTSNIAGVAEDYFDATMIGSPLCVSDSGTIGYGIITAVASPTSATVNVTRDFPASAAAGNGTTLWYESAWSNYRGWPRTVTYWNGALYFGGSPTFPDRIWRSATGDIFEMANPATQNSGDALGAADPYFADIAVAQEISQINGLTVSGNNMLALTRGREYSISDFDRDAISIKPQTSFGAEYRQTINVGDSPVYVQRGFRKLRQMVFDDRIQGYQSPDLTLLAEHMPRLGKTVISGATDEPKIKEMAYQALDNSILWVLDNNGFLFGCTKHVDGNVVAFHRHDVGGKVLSIASLSSKDGTHDELYMIVERTINSITEIYLEKIGRDFYEATLNPGGEDRSLFPVFSDSAKIFKRSAAANFFVSFNSGTTAETAGGTATGTTTGTLTHGQRKGLFGKTAETYVDYDGTSNVDFAQEGTIGFWTIANANSNNETFFAICKAAGDADNLITMWTDSTDHLFLTINDSGGTPIINAVDLGDMDSRVDGNGFKIPQYIELNYELTTGATRVFLNGDQFGSTIVSTGTRDTSIDLLRIGSSFDAAANSWVEETCIWDFRVYDSVQNTADYEVFEYQPTGVALRGLDYLEGETVQVTADGNYIGDFTVASGAIADIGADYTASTIIVVGLAYTSTLEIQPVDVGSGIGSGVGSIKRVDRAVVRFRESAAASVGESTSNLDTLIFRDDDTALTDPIVLVTDDKYMEFPGGYSRTARAVIQTSDPLPMNVTCLSLRGITGDV